jgi:hypothetical protein
MSVEGQLGGGVGLKIGITGAAGAAAFAFDFLFILIGFGASDFSVVLGGSFQPAVNSR